MTKGWTNRKGKAPTVDRLIRWIFCILTTVILSSVFSAAHAQSSNAAAGSTIPGTVVDNTATISFSVNGFPLPDVPSNTASFTVAPVSTPSTIEFLRYAPGNPQAAPVQINGADFSTSSSPSGPFSPHLPLATTSGVPIDTTSPVPLAPTAAYVAGEPVFVRVTDDSRNFDPAAIDLLVVTLKVEENGDTEFVRLYETAPNSGVFVGCSLSGDQIPPTSFNGILAVGKEVTVTATYSDPYDSGDISVAAALVDPFGLVFDSATGAPVDGVTVTLLDASTGLPATVLGIDGISAFPATLLSGGTVTDSSGQVYNFVAGEFRFPLVAPGSYQLEITAPGGYQFPSTESNSAIQILPGGPFALVTGSRGEVFTISPGPAINIDIPLDPRQNLFLTKTASVESAAVGDFVKYDLTLQNTEITAANPLVLTDVLPLGFRYRRGSARIDGLSIADPVVGPAGQTLSFNLGSVPAGTTIELTYVTEIGVNTPTGPALNLAFASAPGGFLSNQAGASVRIIEDLLRSRFVLVGRVSENACNPSDAWPRQISDGTGVAGVRLYLEDGTYVVTDKDGLYHLEGLRPGVHVIQLDVESLPEGYEVIACEQNTRFAGRPYSQFVDVQGGTLWRANFYLKRVGELAEKPEQETLIERQTGAEFDQAWLDAQTPEVDWIYPAPGSTPAVPSVHIGVKHGSGDRISLQLNGRDVPGLNFEAVDRSKASGAAISRWRGIDIQDGENIFTVIVKNASGKETARFNKIVSFVTEATRVHYLEDRSVLAADGRTHPVIALRLTDDQGRPLHAGSAVTVVADPPYYLQTAVDRHEKAPLTSAISTRSGGVVGSDGVALISLAPTLRTGRVTLRVKLPSGDKEIKAWLKPEKRDWILVGLAEGTIGHNRVSRNMQVFKDNGGDKNIYSDGRVAFFAKGTIKGEWLLTLAYDSERKRGRDDVALFQQINPNAYYTLYGDAGEQDYEAESRYPLYVKLEREQFFALFGDYDTELDQTELAQYERRLSGLKTAYEDERFSLVLFAADTDQGFVKDELRADGTVGPYRLGSVPLVRNSETITLETRDRFRQDVIVKSQRLGRFRDYDIDYDTGVIIFKLPVATTDNQFNPNFIVVDYESVQNTERHFTYGGRGAVRLLDDSVEVGASYIHQGGSATVPGMKSNLYGSDLTIQIGENTEFKAEYARSDTVSGVIDTNGEAMIAEITHTSSDLEARAYIRQEDDGFGLGQQSISTSSKRRYGGEASYVIARQDIGDNTILPGISKIEAESYQEKDLFSRDRRSVGEIRLTQTGKTYEISAGLRHIEDRLGATGEKQKTTQLVTDGLYRLFDEKLTLHATHEQDISGQTSDAFPTRTLFGASYRLADWAVISGSHEFRNGESLDLNNTHIGITFTPWRGGSLFVAGDRLFTENGTRLASTLGVSQSYAIDANWSVSGGFERRDIVKDSTGPFTDFTLDQDLVKEDYTLGHAGVGYTEKDYAVSARAEVRDGDSEDKMSFTAGAIGDLSEELSISGRLDLREIDFANSSGGGDEKSADLRLAAAFRPRSNEGLIILNRVDLSITDDRANIETWKIVGNFNANMKLDSRTQLAVQYGAKYASADIGGQTFDSITQLGGVEMRYDINENWDIGGQGFALHSVTGGQLDYSAGLSVGYSPFTNSWISLGYNFLGFRDEDFDGSEYTARGPFLRFRIKFDQDTVRNALSQVMGR